MEKFKITNDPTIAVKENPIPAALREQIEDLYEDVVKGKKSTIKKIQQLILKYPQSPVLKNYLSVVYSKLGLLDKVHEVTREIVKAHPGYLFGKVNLATEYIYSGEYEKVIDVFDGKFEINELYPDREVFHESEIKSFYSTLIRYYIGVMDYEKAEEDIGFLKASLPDADVIPELETLLQHAKSNVGYSRIMENDKKLIKVKIKPTPITDFSTPPVFNHEEINYLYQNGFDIDNELLNKIRNLPRKTLIEDLHKVIDDSITRYGYFKRQYEKYGFDEKQFNFLNHAVFLIYDLRSKESLHKIFEVIRQDDDFIEFYFGDLFLEFMWMILYVLAGDRLDVLKDRMYEPGIYTFNKAAIPEMVMQLAFIEEQRKEEAIQWFRDIFNYNLKCTPADNVIDSELLGLMVSYVLDLKAVSLMPELELMYEKGIVDELSCGDIDAVKKHFEDGTVFGSERSLKSIHEIYEQISSWGRVPEDDYEEDEEDEDDYDYEDEPLVIPKKVGRNDPCPCGSGKKYKKCCGK